MTRQSLALIDVFSSIPDFRQSKGKRHPLKSILALAAAAMMCGYRSYSAMAEWGHNYGQDLAGALGFTIAPILQSKRERGGSELPGPHPF